MKIINRFLVGLFFVFGCSNVHHYTDDENFKYFIAKGELKRTVEEAHRIATEDLFKQISEYVGVEVSTIFISETSENGRKFKDKLETKTEKLFLQSHIIDTQIDEIKEQNLVTVTLVAQYPKSELNDERNRIEHYRAQKRNIINNALSKIEAACQNQNFPEIENQLPVIFGSDYSDNDQRSVQKNLAALHETVSFRETRNDSMIQLTCIPSTYYFLFGKGHTEKVNVSSGTIIFSSNLSGLFSPFNLNLLQTQVPVSIYQQMELFAYPIKRNRNKFSFEFEFNSENQINLESFKDNFYSSLTQVGFENNSKEAKFRVTNRVESFTRSNNIGGVISVGLKVITTIKSIKDKRTATFASGEMIGFGGSEKDASKNASDKIQTYLSSDWIDSFNYIFYENFN